MCLNTGCLSSVLLLNFRALSENWSKSKSGKKKEIFWKRIIPPGGNNINFFSCNESWHQCVCKFCYCNFCTDLTCYISHCHINKTIRITSVLQIVCENFYFLHCQVQTIYLQPFWLISAKTNDMTGYPILTFHF